MSDDALRIIFKSVVVAKIVTTSLTCMVEVGVCELGRQTATRGIYTSLRSGVKVSGNAWERRSQARYFCHPAFPGLKHRLFPWERSFPGQKDVFFSWERAEVF